MKIPKEERDHDLNDNSVLYILVVFIVLVFIVFYFVLHLGVFFFLL